MVLMSPDFFNLKEANRGFAVKLLKMYNFSREFSLYQFTINQNKPIKLI